MEASVSLNRTRMKRNHHYRNIFLIRFITFNRSNESELVTLSIDSQLTSVYCLTGDFGCGDGGWTPVMKIDGNKVRQNFLFLF